MRVTVSISVLLMSSAVSTSVLAQESYDGAAAPTVQAEAPPPPTYVGPQPPPPSPPPPSPPPYPQAAPTYPQAAPHEPPPGYVRRPVEPRRAAPAYEYQEYDDYYYEPPPKKRRGRRQKVRPPKYVSGQPLPPGVLPPPRFRYIDGTTLPEGYRIEEQVNRGLVTGGAVAFGVPYLTGLFVASYEQGERGTGYLAIPVVGPWLMMGNRSSSCGDIGTPVTDRCDSDRAVRTLLFTSGVFQTVGAGLMVLGIVNKQKWAVANYAGLEFTPVASPSMSGLMISGSL
jgi:hypothetical protein